ncbi:unknown similar to AMEV104 [Mythimna separata entomopoxvirus 'L']|uniref:Uncharacterized protein n=1 Tax=Mythimna separata entomopoxvirus 'L' TaxID=1293572 RepID=A0A916NYD7_9POXV|nr:unknown similar to AMEV104 [Mythimna separata entomopoxvirus 'L']CCU56318.1 unknown similar to AMEV104 [Mythimna separata entomopoxvirus 'L']
MAEYIILYNCDDNIKSYKDIDITNDINIYITSDDYIIKEELDSYESPVYKIINYDNSDEIDYDCDLILIPKHVEITNYSDKLKKILEDKTEIIIVSKFNANLPNIIKDMEVDGNITYYNDFKYIIDITNFIFTKNYLKKINSIKVTKYEDIL